VRHLLLLFLSQLEFKTPVIQRERPLPQLPTAQSGQVTPLEAGAKRERSRMNEPLLTRVATMRVRATSGGITRQIGARPLRLDCLDCLICFQYSRRGAVLALLFPAASPGSPGPGSVVGERRLNTRRNYHSRSVQRQRNCSRHLQSRRPATLNGRELLAFWSRAKLLDTGQADISAGNVKPFSFAAFALQRIAPTVFKAEKVQSILRSRGRLLGCAKS